MTSFKIHEDILEQCNLPNLKAAEIVPKKFVAAQNRVPFRSKVNDANINDKITEFIKSESEPEIQPESDRDATELEEILQIVNFNDHKENYTVQFDEFILSNKDNIYLCTREYSESIFKHLLNVERSIKRPKCDYMKKQPELNFHMRSILVDWLSSVAEEYNLHTQTLHLAIQYIDCFLSHMSVVKTKFQLVGTVAMMIAAKYEEIYPPSTNDWIYMTANCYSTRQIMKMEMLVLKVLTFDLAQPTLCLFITHLCAVFEIPKKVMLLSLYIAELVLLEGEDYIKHLPSELAFACVALARYTLQENEIWPTHLKTWTGYSLQQLSPLIKRQQKTFEDSPKKEHQSIQLKFSERKYGKVSCIKPRQLNL